MDPTIESDLKKHFTSEGFGLLESYFQTLQSSLVKEGISSDQIYMVTNGIVEFITEYISGLEENLINFSTTLHLIEEIGSPTEIIQSIDNKHSEIFTTICAHCNTVSLGGSFCENCGKFIARSSNNSPSDYEIDQTEKISNYLTKSQKQDVIDHPYSRSFIIYTAISYFSFIFYAFVSSFLNINWITLNNTIRLLIEINTYPFFSIFLSLLFCLIFGFLINIFFKNKKTNRFQFYDILENYDQNSFIGFLFVYFGSSLLFFLFLFLLYTPIFWKSIGFILLLAIPFFNYIYFIYYRKQFNQNETLSFNQLSILNDAIKKINHDKYTKINLIIILPALALEFIILLFVPNYNVFSLVIFVLLLSVICLLIVNGFYIMKLNSWQTIVSYAKN